MGGVGEKRRCRAWCLNPNRSPPCVAYSPKLISSGRFSNIFVPNQVRSSSMCSTYEVRSTGKP
jgi:hypothetical protein